eukprot:scaffold208978_cov23-Tisochrysis_lutea.AAC.3
MSSLAASCRMHASMADTVGAEDSGELGLVVGLGAGGAAPAPALLWASELELFQPAIMPFRSDSRVLRAYKGEGGQAWCAFCVYYLLDLPQPAMMPFRSDSKVLRTWQGEEGEGM